MSEKRTKQVSKADQQKSVEALRKAIKGGKTNRIAHIAELAEHILGQWGGAQKFAISFKEVFDTSSPMGRASMMRDAMKLIEISSRGLEDKDDLSTMSDAELLQSAKDIGLSIAPQEETSPPIDSGGTGTDCEGGTIAPIEGDSTEVTSPTANHWPDPYRGQSEPPFTL